MSSIYRRTNKINPLVFPLILGGVMLTDVFNDALNPSIFIRIHGCEYCQGEERLHTDNYARYYLMLLHKKKNTLTLE